ncbi:protein of unknown function [Klenkia soli]|uniref:DUF4349 domain-containing protein n=1 Tax=Klenkia soli TaxID=1052260 RepID=A0A1H0T1V1_9ACTN|nr:DUF4349 domain-containing protein [Klenkia soli]SDP48057.1 protein of unknown function [Klenkia soli]
MKRSPCVLTTTLAAALAAVLVGGCSASEGTSSDAGAVAVAEPGVQSVAPGEPTTERQVVTTASTSLVVEDAADSAQRVSELAEGTGGRVDERSEQRLPDGGGTADLVLRVPATELTGLLDDLGELGDVQDVSVSRDDVTSTAVDLDARISALRTSAARLEALMAGATTTEALLAAEQALADRQQELESLQSQRTALADQVDLSTLGVHLAEDAASPDAGPGGFLGGLDQGWQALLSTLGAAVVVLGVLLPWLVVAALVAVVAVPLVRRARRRRVAAPPPEPTGA